ncbi:developmental pluripotency-associated 5 protein-like [Vulpes vulpes]|uniref:Developmental pluripotency-associated 5 protein-like n=1 Tax=Vulpes vulpes TaxID=9627 RepID=A0ABM4YMF6_VULVU
MAPFVMKTLHRSHGSGASKKYSHSKNWLLVHTQRYWCRFKHFLKPSVLHVDARLLEKIFGPSRALVPGFEREFKVLLQMREPNSEGKVEILIMGRRRYRKRAKRLIRILAAKPRGRRSGGTMMFSLETMKSFERKNVHSDDFLSTAVMSSLDEAMQSLEIGQETVQEPVTKTV